MYVYNFLNDSLWSDLSVSGVRVPSMSEWAIIASYTADQSERHYKSKVNADGFSWINFNKTLIEILKNWIIQNVIWNLVFSWLWTSAETFVTKQIINQEQEIFSGSLDLFYNITG